MNRVQLVWIFYETVVVGGAETPLASEGVSSLSLLLDLLERSPEARFAVHLTGSTLEQLAGESNDTQRIATLARAGRLELLSGGYLAPVLSSCPEPDVLAQLLFAQRYIKHISGSPPTGVWLAEQIWDASTIPLLNRAGLSLAFVSGEQLRHSSAAPDSPDGVWQVERLGHLIRVMATDDLLSALAPAARASDLREYLSGRAEDGGGMICCAIPLRRLPQMVESNFSEFLSRLPDEDYWLRMHLPGVLSKAVSPRGQTWLPASMPGPIAARALPMALDVSLEQCKPKRGCPFRPVPWEFFFARYPEANLFHKHMLYVSGRLRRMRSVVESRADRGENVAAFAKAVAHAYKALYRAQCHEAFWPGAKGGIYNPNLRLFVHRSLLEAQRLADGLFFPEPRWVSCERLDLDRDGHEEILVNTPRLVAGLATRGGCAYELSYKPARLPLLALMGRRWEPVHRQLSSSGVGEPNDGETKPAPPLLPEAGALESRIHYDRYPRGLFLDHFLGPSATLNNFYRCQYPEMGDYLNMPYEVIKAAYDRRAGVGLIHLSRNGTVVGAGQAEPASIRVEKIYTFDDDGRHMQVRYALTNRGHTPARFVFGSEMAFGPAVSPVSLSGEGVDPQQFSATEPPPVMGEAEGYSILELQSPDQRIRFEVAVDQPGRWWWFGIETIHEEEGAAVARSQGTVFMPIWHFSLWGEETRSVTLSLRVTDELETASSAIIEDEGLPEVPSNPEEPS